MGVWNQVRDWEVSEAISDLPDNSYDFVGRDFPVGDTEAHFLQYRRQSYLVEAGFFYSGNRSEAMEDLESAREVLMDSAFTPRIFLEDAEAARTGYGIELEGEYFFDQDTSEELVVNDLEDLMPDETNFSDLSEIRCKK